MSGPDGSPAAAAGSNPDGSPAAANGLDEWALIAAAAAQAGAPPPGALGIGDDAALLPLPAGLAVLTTDVLVEDVHFRRSTPSEDLGWKALAVNLSDVAAMGGTPVAALVSLSLPATLAPGWVDAFWRGFHALAGPSGVWLAGGDTTGSPGPIFVAVTLVGSLPPTRRALRRDAARPGDVLFVTGVPGLAARGFALSERPRPPAGADNLGTPHAAAGTPRPATNALTDARALEAHRRPVPQLALGAALAASGLGLALLDDSDGLARSARLLASASGVDVTITQAPLQALIAPFGVTLAEALHGGEDYHLTGACRPADWPAIAAIAARTGHPATRVGAVTAARDPRVPMAYLQAAPGAPEALAGEVGFSHFARTGQERA